jgi:hypothetical protein
MSASRLATANAGSGRFPLVVAGGLVAGTLDLVYVCTLVQALHGLGPGWILRSVAAGWLGRDAAFAGGTGIALLGAATHYGIAIAMAIAYYQAAKRLPALARNPVLYGPVYGIALYIIMNFVVAPLSAAASQWQWHWIQLAHLAAHMFLVGLPCALASARALRSGTD